MTEAKAYEFWKKPQTEELFMLAGFRQWADAGSVSSGFPQYLVQHSRAESIGRLRSDGYYLFQVPGTHDLMRPVVHFEDGFPVSLETQHNDFYYTGDSARGLVIFMGDEPHLDIERYVASLLSAARMLGVSRILSLGGVYGELPYDRERTISAIYSLPRLHDDLARLAVTFSDYKGGASIDSILAKRAGEQGMEFAGLYAFVPAYDFSLLADAGASSVRLENDFTAWLGLAQRINYFFKMNFDLSDLEHRSRQLMMLMSAKIDELDNSNPQLGVREYVEKLSEEFQEVTFNPLDEVWDEELKRLLNKMEDEPEEDENSGDDE